MCFLQPKEGFEGKREGLKEGASSASGNQLPRVLEGPFERAEELLQKYGSVRLVLNHYLEGDIGKPRSREWDGVESGRDTNSDSGSIDRWSFGESNSELNSIDNISSESMSINSDEGKEVLSWLIG